MDVFVEEATEATLELAAAVARLVPQLSSSPPPDQLALATIVASPATVLFVARLAGEGEEQGTEAGGASQIVGMLTLVLFRIPSGMRAWIEDVVVDGPARGQGVGESLNLAALDRAADAGARTVDLTSRSSRESANRLYQRIGFQPRETNVWRFEVGADEPRSALQAPSERARQVPPVVPDL